MDSTYLREINGNTVIHCRIQPAASKTTVAGIYDNQIKITLAAPPVDGKANKTLKAFIAKKLHISKSRVSIIKGDKNKSKQVLCSDILPETVKEILLNEKK